MAFSRELGHFWGANYCLLVSLTSEGSGSFFGRFL
jgi:hypothetical protein